MRLIVVGTGIVGAACGYAASRLGADVTFVDAAAVGRATAAGAGVICPWTSEADDPAWYAFSRAAVREYPSLVAGLSADDVSYRQVGALALADEDGELERIRARVVARRAEAPEIGEVRILADGEAQRMFPPLREGTRAVFIGGAARVDGRQLAGALLKASGATIRTGWATLSCDGGRVTGVMVDGKRIEADAVVAAAGAWTASLVEPAGVTVRVVPQRGQIMHIGLVSADTSDWPVVLPSATGHYMLAFGDSRVVAGATREAESGFDVRVTPGGLSEVLANALSVAPGLASGTHLETRVGLRPAGPDGRPLLGAVPAVAGLVVATGLGANGLTAGPYAGTIAARIALGLAPGIDLEPFDPLRLRLLRGLRLRYEVSEELLVVVGGLGLRTHPLVEHLGVIADEDSPGSGAHPLQDDGRRLRGAERSLIPEVILHSRDELAQVVGGRVLRQDPRLAELVPPFIVDELRDLGVGHLLRRRQAAGAAGVRDNVGAHVTRHDQNHPDLRRIAAQVFDQRLGEALDGELRRGVGIVRHAGA